MTMMKPLSVVMRVLVFAMGVAVGLPLVLWLIVQGYDWLCATWVACGGT